MILRRGLSSSLSKSCKAEIARLLQDSASFNDTNDRTWGTTPYPEGAAIIKEDFKPPRDPISPLDKSVIIFPGQGTLKVGTVERYLKFPHVKDMFDIASDILRYDLLKLCLNGPQEKLNRTLFNQPATVVASLAALDQLREERPTAFDNCVATVGYSIGELTCMIFAGVLSYEDGIKLVAVRGAAMERATNNVPQGMLSVYCTPTANLDGICKEAKAWAVNAGVVEPVCSVAIYLCTQTKILAGHKQALDYIEKNGDKFGLSKMQRLPVSGAFHTSLMRPALGCFRIALDNIQLEAPRTVVISNVTAEPHRSVDDIRRRLVQQIVRPVKWEQSIQKVYSRAPGLEFPRSFDVGSNGRMKTLLRMINVKAAYKCQVV